MPESDPLPCWETAVQIEILNWDKYNPRKDIKSTSWLRLENNFCMSPDLFDLTNDQKMIWIFVLCEASKRQQGVIAFNAGLAAAVLRMPVEDAVSTIDVLETKGLVALRARDVCVTPTLRARSCTPRPTIPTDGRTDETDETDGRDGRDGTLTTVKPPRARPRVDPKPLKPTHSEADLAVGSSWLAYALVEMPWKTGDPSWTALAFAESLAKVRRATGVSEGGLVELLRFVSADDFWRDKACSPAGLLKKSARNGERKIDNILVRMRTKEDRTLDTMQQWAKENYRE